MGVKERRERERQATRQGILTGARHIARVDGWPALTIRKVGEYIEYSPSMVYEYFSSKEDILLELFREGFRQLADRFQQAYSSTDDPEERLFRIAEAYLAFARANPDLYQVMHSIGGVAIHAEAQSRTVQEVTGIVQRALEEWAAATGVTLADPAEATELMWCTVHGIVSAMLIDRLAGGETGAQRLIRRATQDFIAARRTRRPAR